MMERRCMGCMRLLEEEAVYCPDCGYKVGTAPLEAYHMAPGTVLEERYLIGRVLGFGGFGITYLGYDLVLDKKTAIKEYLPGEFATRMPNQTQLTIYSGEKEEQFQAGKEKFIDEARRLAKFQSVPEVVHVFDCFEANDTAYIVMEFLDGETLKTRLERTGKMSVEQALPVIFDVLHALEAVHEEKILHRDIAPDNIFITKDDQIKLLDFGAARFATTTRSRSLTVLFKPGYAPEEQYRSRGDQGTWTDVYSLAAVFYRMITGITPEDALERSVHDTLKRPSKLGVKIGPNTENALMNALNVTVESRTQTAKQFEDELMANVVKRIVVKKEEADVGRWPRWVKVLAAVGAAGILTFAGLMAAGVIRFDAAGWSVNKVPEGKTRVPNLVNEEMETAIARGQEAKLNVQVYDKQYSEEIPENKVLSQTIKRGTVVEENETLGIIISAGIEKTYVPNVIGMESEEAKQLLKDAGLVVNSTQKEYRAAPGTIGWQSLEPDLETDTGTAIEIIISEGIKGGDSSKEEAVEDLTGKDYDTAADEMLARYLYLVNKGAEYSDTVEAGGIIRQEPAAGSRLSQNSNISVIVSLGRELVGVPDVQYKTQEEATAMMESVGLGIEVVQEASDTVAQGNVIRQETPAGERIEKGSQVVIYVSTGAPQRQPERPANNRPAQQPQQPQPQNNPVPQETAPPQTEAPPQTTQAPAQEDSGMNPAFRLLE
ncbi:PASTA domain-containing protein [Clostridium sp. MCC353]|uniref:Stk1 family PASTA domain-containing Ser/Thr kinase n=1 Tax=Clostridium sp. MCC353 TaxID=2592646 RepID=UPI001C021E9B|nr:Stk1 family PASTA domain-containing Ser/Thr kinase [Clostridium sp. MCC353]MBT9776430.1 PASTA domain-containing protein [Clostridium sp. MCC353]